MWSRRPLHFRAQCNSSIECNFECNLLQAMLSLNSTFCNQLFTTFADSRFIYLLIEVCVFSRHATFHSLNLIPHDLVHITHSLHSHVWVESFGPSSSKGSALPGLSQSIFQGCLLTTNYKKKITIDFFYRSLGLISDCNISPFTRITVVVLRMTRRASTQPVLSAGCHICMRPGLCTVT